MKNISLLVLLLPLFSYGQFKSSVSWLYHHANNSKQLADSCVYNEDGAVIFCRQYNLFKENDYEDKRYTYHHSLLIKTVSYDMSGQPWLTDSIGYDQQNRIIAEKVYRNNTGEVLMDKMMKYEKDSVTIVDGKMRYVLVKGVLYRDTVVISRTEYSNNCKRVIQGEFVVETTDEGVFTYKNGILISSVKGAEKVFYDVPVKKEITRFDKSGLKKTVEYYEGDKYYQHLEYSYRR
jgi:hypothetical protein